MYKYKYEVDTYVRFDVDNFNKEDHLMVKLIIFTIL